jgi:hypothetical protein
MVEYLPDRVVQLLATFSQLREFSLQRRRDWFADELPENGP